MSTLRIGMDVYLTPKTIGAPGVAYRHPRGRVIGLDPPEVTVELADGARVTTHQLNVALHAPVPPAPRPRVLQKRDRAIDPQYGTETTIFDHLDESA